MRGSPKAAPARSRRSIYAHNFVRVALCTPPVQVADPISNLEQTIQLAHKASECHAALAVFPELGLSAYSNEDLFFQDALLDQARRSLSELVDESRRLFPVLIVGAPLRFSAKLFNCAVVIHRGVILGVVPKSYLPNYREFYERRQFTPGAGAISTTVELAGTTVPFGADLIFTAEDYPDFALHVEICEDLWVPLPPSAFAALAGATLLTNLSASNITIGKPEYRRLLCASQSGRCIAGYLYSAAGPGESTTDLAWDGHALIYENAELLAEGARYPHEPRCLTADIDLDRLVQERARTNSFNDCANAHRGLLETYRHVGFRLGPPRRVVPLERTIPRFPFVPTDPRTRNERCAEVHTIQVEGLVKRLTATSIQRIVIGISGGLDSTQALLVSAQAMDRLGLPRRNVLAFTMPGFATSETTRANAWRLMQSLGVAAAEIDIRPSAEQMLRDLGHPYSHGEPVFDITFENVQAGERTSHLFRLANQHRALVVGTSDLSELALGYTTYGVGDHMSHYAVNASVPKTLVKYLVRWAAETKRFGGETSRALEAILDTAISPELVPATESASAQRAEDEIGPYALQDFNLYYFARYGYRPSKVLFLAEAAWSEHRGNGEPPIGDTTDQGYSTATIRRWLEVFLHRFFQFSQFKRSALPNGPKVGSGGSLSPRGDWRAPSDASAAVWLAELFRADRK